MNILNQLLFYDATLVLQVLFKLEFLPVVNTIGIIPDPVAQTDDPAVIGNADVEREVTVTEYEVFDGGILFQFLPGKLYLVFPVSLGKGTDGPMFLAAAFGPTMGKGHGSIGMDAGIEPLSAPVFEGCLEQSVHSITGV